MVLIERKERELLIRSEATGRDYPGLLRVLRDCETLSDNDPSYAQLDDVTKSMLNLPQAKKDFIDEVSTEWIVTKRDEGSDNRLWVPCEMCGTKNEYLRHIINIHNQRELNVGSTCVERFRGIDQTVARKEEAQARRQGRNSKRLAEINVRFPGISDAITGGYSAIEDGPFVLPLQLHTSTKQVLDEIKRLHDSFAKGSVGKECFGEISASLDKFDELKSKIADFNSQAGNDKFACNHDTQQWLKRKNMAHIVDGIRKNGGRVSQVMARNIYAEAFVGRFLSEIKRCVDTDHFTLESVDDSHMRFCLTYGLKSLGRRKVVTAYNIKLFCKTSEFMRHFNDVLFKAHQTDVGALADILSVEISDRSQNGIRELLDTVLNDHVEEYIFDYDGYIYKMNAKGETWSKRVCIEPQVFLNKFVKTFFMIGTHDFREQLINTIKNLKNWESRQDADASRKARQNR